MNRSNVQLRRQTTLGTDGSTRTSLTGFVNGMKAYVPNIILQKENESEEESIQQFIKEVNAGLRDVTGMTAGGETRTNKAGEEFTTTASCVWGTTFREATAEEKLDMQNRIEKVLTRKAERPEGTPVVDRVSDMKTAIQSRLDKMREAAALTTLATAETEPSLS